MPQSKMRLSRTMDKFYSKLFLSIIIGSLLVFITLHMKIASHNEDELLVPATDMKSLVSKNVRHTLKPLENKGEDESHSLVEEAALRFSAEHEMWKQGFSAKVMNESTNVILLSYLGSGATVIGDLLSRKSDTIYFNDPTVILNDFKFDKAQLLKSLFDCDFKNEISRKYLEKIYSEKNSLGLFYAENPHFLRICRDLNLDLDECLEVEKLSEICSGFQNRLIFTQSITLIEIQPLILNHNIRLIFMTRDPRGLIYSRDFLSMDGNLTNPEIVCEQLISDLELSQKISKFKPQSVMPLVFEKFVFSPLEVTDSIYTWLSWKKNEADIKLFLNRIPLGLADLWVPYKDTEIIKDVDKKCSNIFDKSSVLGEFRDYYVFEKLANKI